MAGVPIDLGDEPFYLIRCDDCGFRFKHPSIAEEKLLACYAQADASHWEDSPDPHVRRFDVVADLVQRHAVGNDILDVGCSNGSFLRWLGGGWERFGIEPGAAAASTARQRGIRVIGSTLDDVVVAKGRYDVLVLFDVVEHVSDPRRFFARARQCLREEGILVTITADTESLPWRLQGSRYWYCSLPEHVSFFSSRTLRWIASRFELVEIESRLLSHARSRASTVALELAKNLAFTGITQARGLGIARVQRTVVERSAPTWISARDHLFHVMQAV